MFDAIVLSTWLAVQNTETPCFILGEVSSSQQQGDDLASTNCPIHIKREGQTVTMTSPKWMVQVQIPEDQATHKFVYQWGQSEAQIDDRPVQVTYQPIEER